MSAKPQKTMHKCAYCGTTFDRALTPAMPFCSERCRQIDLGNWLDESYGLPYKTGVLMIYWLRLLGLIFLVEYRERNR